MNLPEGRHEGCALFDAGDYSNDGEDGDEHPRGTWSQRVLSTESIVSTESRKEGVKRGGTWTGNDAEADEEVPTDTLNGPPDNQHRHIFRHGADQRSQLEKEDSGEEHPFGFDDGQ